MDLIIIVVAIGVLISLVVVMFRYAGVYSSGVRDRANPDENQEKDETDNPSNKDKE